MTAKPPDFEPLASADPVSGDVAEIAALGKRYTDTAAEIAQQASNLRKLAASAPDGWKGQAGPVFASKATDLAGRITAAEQRYSTAGKALTDAAGPMGDAQQRAYAAVWAAKSAQQTMNANQPAPPRPAGSPPPTEAEKTAARTKAGNYSDAQTALHTARSHFDTAVGDYHSAAATAATTITNELNHDSLKDSWWDRNFGWISKVFMVIAIVIIVLAVVALVIACPLTAGLLAAWLGVSASTLATVGTVIGWVAFGLTIAQTVYDGVAAGTGKESWTAFALDLVALATFGLGKGVEAIGEGLAEGGESVAKAVAGTRAGRAAMSANGLPGFLYSIASRSDSVAGLVKLLGGGDALSAASDAAKAATATVEEVVKGASATNLTTLLTMSSGIGEDAAKLNAINKAVPGVMRIGARLTLLQGLAGAEGIAQWGSFLGGGAFTINGIATGG